MPYFCLQGFLADVNGALGNHVADRGSDRRHALTDAGDLAVTHDADRFILTRPHDLSGLVRREGHGFQRDRLADRLQRCRCLTAAALLRLLSADSDLGERE